jgi:hypothetical protein
MDKAKLLPSFNKKKIQINAAKQQPAHPVPATSDISNMHKSIVVKNRTTTIYMHDSIGTPIRTAKTLQQQHGLICIGFWQYKYNTTTKIALPNNCITAVSVLHPNHLL